MQKKASLSQLFIFFLLSFLGGVFLNSFFEISVILVYELLGLALFFLVFSFWRKKSLVFFVLFLGLVGGIGRFQFAEKILINSPLRDYFSQEITVEGWICQEPEISDTQSQLVFCPFSLDNSQGDQKVSGRVLLTTGLYPTYQYGDHLKAVGQIQEPISSSFNYQGYLARQGIVALMTHPYLEKLIGSEGSSLKKLAIGIKTKLKNAINQAFSLPASALLKAMLLGDRSDLSVTFKNQLVAIGLIHLIAISGLHLVILSNLFLIFARNLRLKESWAVGLTLVLLWSFVFMVGGRPSIMRAAVMSSFLLIGGLIHRPASSLRFLILAAVLLLLVNPLSLRMDVGFQLSFLAALGIIWLKPILMKKRKSSLILDLLGTTFSAQLLVFPILLYAFGQVSLISPLSNLLVTPFLPLFFALGFSVILLTAICSIFIPVGQILLWPLLWYVISVTGWLSHLPGIVWYGVFPGWGLFLFYFLLFGFFMFRDPLHLFPFSQRPFQISGRC